MSAIQIPSATEMKLRAEKAKELIDKKRLEELLKEDPDNIEINTIMVMIDGEASFGRKFLNLGLPAIKYEKTEIILKQHGYSVKMQSNGHSNFINISWA